MDVGTVYSQPGGLAWQQLLMMIVAGMILTYGYETGHREDEGDGDYRGDDLLLMTLPLIG